MSTTAAIHRNAAFEAETRAVVTKVAQSSLLDYASGVVPAAAIDFFRHHLGGLGSRHPTASAVDSAQSITREDAFLEGVYEYARNGQLQQGSVAVMTHLDNLLHAARFDECNRILATVQVQRLAPRIALSFLTITNLLPRTTLPYRSELVSAIESKLAAELGEERARTILVNLR